ncbi:tetratricopeptide repeat protein [Pannus brasiliensis CCIBt3594]|uniref:Tetratricopeptide repeat protein n=1 Tax=Pannus brasiliensis CCIBt3594 TaxID=1427578 RepID=A0AAW9QU48_9CHRO
MKELQDRAYGMLRQGRYETAIDWYRECIEASPEERENYWFLGLALLLGDREEEAGELWFSVFLQATPEDAEIWSRELRELLIQEARSYQSIGYLSRAEVIYRALLEQEISAETYYYLATVLADRGEFAEASTYYRESLRLDPNYSPAYNGIARSLLSLGYFLEAYSHASRSIDLDPDNLQYWIWYSIALKKISFNRADDRIITSLLKCFETPAINQQNLAGATMSIVRLDPNFRSIADSIELDDLEGGMESRYEALAALGKNRLFQYLLKDTLIANLTFEKVLTEIRKLILLESSKHQYLLDEIFLDTAFVSALALQCFNNEYIFIDSPFEKEIIFQLKEEIETTSLDTIENLENKLAVCALYHPLYQLNVVHDITLDRQQYWTQNTKILWKRTVIDYFEEQDLKRSIEAIPPISNRISSAVQSQYEENPYPRWLKISALDPSPLPTFVKSLFPHFSPPEEWIDRPLEILCAGCGTGSEPISIAIGLKDADILAIDLSSSSLAYASRMAKELKIEKIQFKQADILGLSDWSRKFSMIFSTGVLHHLENPIDGLTILVDRLPQKGLLCIGLYSARARKFIANARKFIADRGYQNTAEDIRMCRKELIESSLDFAIKLTYQYDFYSLSNCRDLMFHVNEHCFTIPEIKRMLDRAGLQFIGFSNLEPKVQDDYRKMFPEDRDMNDLERWNRFEEIYPDTFIGMYNMWCQKL